MAESYVVRPATLDDVAALGAIEDRASELFRGLVPDEIAADNVPEATLSAAAGSGRLLVAEISGKLVAFALVLVLSDGTAHLEELDVVPEQGRRGIGSALVEAACRWASANGHLAITLSTYRDVAFNAPYYAR